jgi:membrane associated rhomboid family serine protease
MKDAVLNSSQRRPRVPLYPLWIVIVACILPELCFQLTEWGIVDAPRLRAEAYENAGFWSGLLDNWKPNYALQPYLMFLSYGFLHSGPVHLVVNMVTLWSLGRPVIERVGARGFALLYLGSLLGGAAGFGLLADVQAPMVGASGALFGLVGGVLAWNYVDRFTFQEGLWPVARAVLLLVGLNLVMWWAMKGQLAWETHLGGFVTGWITALLIDPKSRAAE